MKNIHDIEMQLPLFPTEEVGKGGCSNFDVSVDGKPVKGITSLHVKAGNNGYTNVAIELLAPVVLEMSAALFISTHASDDYPERVLGPMMKQALESIDDVESMDMDDMGRLGIRFMELIIEETKA